MYDVSKDVLTTQKKAICIQIFTWWFAVKHIPSVVSVLATVISWSYSICWRSNCDQLVLQHLLTLQLWSAGPTASADAPTVISWSYSICWRSNWDRLVSQHLLTLQLWSAGPTASADAPTVISWSYSICWCSNCNQLVPQHRLTLQLSYYS